MEQQEKKLIENLFYRLSHSEKKSVNRDVVADNLIKDLLIKQPNAPYYMAQIILVQETVIKKLNDKINKLENDISLIKKEDRKKSSSSFLSGFFSSNNLEKKEKKDNNTQDVSSKFKDNNFVPNNTTIRTVPPYVSPTNIGNNTHSSTASSNNSSFLSGALQTATGVAGGMVMANMLTHLFEHKNPGEEIFNHTNNSHLDPDIVVEREIHNHYIHEDNNHVDSLSDNVHHDHENNHNNQEQEQEQEQDYDENIDITDDNFI